MKYNDLAVSSFVESQFPAFYQEEGPQFIAFVKAYYEWMESYGNPLHHASNLGLYRDVDETLDEFIVYFKEKYLKNIQFDTATKTRLLIKNSLELYRSKGTERSIDLFFKLVYGTNARVGYPAEKIFRLSDGDYKIPQYLEVTYSKYNVDYLGKQIIGSLSGATAFVEKYIRRRAGYGYVNLLYISNIKGDFQKNEIVGIVTNGIPAYNEKRAQLLGSVRRVQIIDKGRNFSIGDIVSFSDSSRGVGGFARVTSVAIATGLVDFLFLEGGYGYTLNANSIVSEKVIQATNVASNSTSDQYYRLLDTAVEPVVNVNFTSASANLALGDYVYRYNASNALVGAGRIIDISQDGANGSATISHVNGSFVNTETYYTESNAVSLYANTVEDRSITGKIMGIPNTHVLTLSSQVGDITIGSNLYQSNSEQIFAYGTVSSIVPTAVGNTVTVMSSKGSYKTTDTLKMDGNTDVTASINNIEHGVGVYDISKTIYRLQYTSANNATITDSDYVYQYDSANKQTSKGLLITASYSGGSGNLTFIPLSGYFEDTQTIYTDSNTAAATLTTYSSNAQGGDFIASGNSRIFTVLTDTTFAPESLSQGSGAEFDVGTIGETEVIFVGTDLINSNNVGYLDFDRRNLSVSSNTGFAVGDYVYQEFNKIAFNPSLKVDAANGFIALPTANSRFIAGDFVRYNVAAGNTVINGLVANDTYYVAFSNTTGIIIAHPYNKVNRINTDYDENFANNLISQTGHYFYKEAYGTVFELGSGLVRTKDNHNRFGTTAAGGNTSVYGNSNLIIVGDTAVNTSISATTAYATLTSANQQFYTLKIREAAYGFPKNPQGDAQATIYSTLNFGRFEIGVIDSLSNVDPGTDYNVDPYILAYQREIAGFGRHDFAMTVKDATSNFVVGEKINQIQANLSYYDLQVDGGVYGNTYDEVVRSVNSKDEVVSGSDFIYVPSTTVPVNITTALDNDTDFIGVSGNLFSNNDLIRYYTDTGNTAITGLSNNSFYYVVAANSTGFKVSATSNGSVLDLTGVTTESFNSNTIVDADNFILLTDASTYFANDTPVTYFTKASNTVISSLANGAVYYVRYANSTGLALSLTSGGANIDIAPQNPGGTGHFLKTYNEDANGHNFVNYSNPHSNGVRVLYTTTTGNTAISGLSNGSAYYVVGSNTVGFQLSTTSGGANINITAAGSEETGHYFSTIPGFLPRDFIYSSGGANATIQSVYLDGSNSFIRIQGNTGVISNTETIQSYTNLYISADIVEDPVLVSVASTAKGIIKAGSNTSVLLVKRITFENTFQENIEVVGDVSGASANVVGVAEDYDTNPIGLNAVIEANVVTANGQVTNLEVIDSGVAYANAEVIQFNSADNTRSGTIKTELLGNGIGLGYYKSTKGFLSADMKIHDGDYYQEYSYEIFSKLSVDKYSDMFRKVMHTAGTKFFGSAEIIEDDSLPLALSEIGTGQEVAFNAQTDVDSNDETIQLDIQKHKRPLNALSDVNMTSDVISVRNNPFLVDDLVLYYTDSGNTANFGLSNNSTYYVVTSNTTGIQLSSTEGGTPVDLDDSLSTSEWGHHLVSYINPFSVGDTLYYYTATGNTVVTGMANATYYNVVATTPNTVKLANTAGSNINITASVSSEVGHYLKKISEES